MENKNISRNLNIAAGQFAKEKEYWKNKLSGELAKSYFPYDPGKFISQDTRKKVVTFKIDGELFERLAQITGRSFPKVHMILVAGTAALLARYTGNRDIIVGTPIDRQDSENDLINRILPLRVRMPGSMTFKELLLEVRDVINEAIDNQNFPIETLLPSLDTRVENHNVVPGAGFPLFDVMVLLENIQERTYVRHIQTGIIILFRLTKDGIEGEVEYNTSLYREDSVNRIIRHYLQLMRTSLFDVNLAINEIELLSPGEKDELARFNRTRAGYPSRSAIHELFELQVEKTPDNIALIDEKGGPAPTLSYRQLNDRANQWGKSLANHGVKPNTIIGIMLRQSTEQICAIFAVLKSGCAYLPIDIDYPPERKSYMLEDSGAALLITQSDLTGDLKWDGEILYIEDIESRRDEPAPRIENPRVQPADLVYVIYTSGSTGKSKGVAVEHRALVNYAWWAAKNYVKNETVHFPLFTSTAFDLTVTSIFTPLITGNSIIIYRGEEKEFLVEKVLNENKVEVLKLTPVHLMFIADYTRLENDSKIKRFIVGGDQLETHLAHQIHRKFSAKVEIYNEYGPTEATVGCMIYKFNPQKDNGSSVPIGTPADNLHIYLLDENMKHVPTGCIGELYIAGDGLARGYLNRPALTAERFIPNSFVPGKRLFRTGDLARMLADGTIDFLGRKDQQVKIRGYRIEIGEVEYYLSKFEGIQQAVVLAKDDEKGYKYLAAYLVTSPAMNSKGTGQEVDMEINIEELRYYLSGYLPEFMIPSYFVPLDRLPVTVNGKVDRKSLPEPGKNTLDTGTQYLPPTTELEKTMVGIWQDVMGVETVGIEDSYFSLGGDSIKAIQISARMQKINLKLELKDLFQYTTIRELANHIKPLKEIPAQGIIEGEVKLTPIQHWFFRKSFPDKHHFNQAVILYRKEGFKEKIVEEVFNRLVEHHDALRMVFEMENGGPRQFNRGLEGQLKTMHIYEIKEKAYEKIVEKKCNQIQRSMDLTRGPLVKLGLFKTIEGDYLLITIHHLVIDGVSWRIIFEDFASFYKQMEKGIPPEEMEIPLKSTPFMEWAEKLYEYSNSKELLKELSYWKKLDDLQLLHLRRNKCFGREKSSGRKKISFELSEVYTEKLLKEVNRAYNTEINDILLAGLGAALSDWAGKGKTLISMEGHGREEIIEGIDITRTVGWFTTLYPVLLDIEDPEDISSIIKNCKEVLRQIPNKGFGYGVLKYLTAVENRPGIQLNIKPEIGFNYLGQFDEDIDTDLFKAAGISPGDSVSSEFESEYLLEILGIISKERLLISVNFYGEDFSEEKISDFVGGYENRLQQIIEHCIKKEDTELTLSDLSTSIENKEAEIAFDILSEITLDEWN